MKYLIILSLLLTVGCNKDVDALLLTGTEAEYSFTNDDLDGYTVNEDWVDQFQLTSVSPDKSETIECLYVGNPATMNTDTVFLYMHGNDGNMNPFWQAVAKMANYGGQHHYGVLMFDYRGFGNSTGTSENIGTMIADVEACAKWLMENGVTEDRIILYGYSLGTLCGSHVAAYSDVFKTSKLVIEAPQTSANTLIQDATGLSLQAGALSDFGYNIPEALENYSDKVLWIHGTADGTASYENFALFYDQYDNSKKERYIEEGAGHAIADDIGFEKMEELIREFIK